jgi:MFS family permease
MALSQPSRNQPADKISYEEFLRVCDEDTLAEWVDGEVVMTSPASNRHQAITSFLLKRWGYRWPMVCGLSIMALFTLLLGDHEFQLWRMLGIHLGVAERLALLIMGMGIGLGIAIPASNNACIELLPAKVATITGLRGMFRYVGGALGISVTTIILHSSSTLVSGFRTTFLSFGSVLLFTLPLVFLMPTGKKEWG